MSFSVFHSQTPYTFNIHFKKYLQFQKGEEITPMAIELLLPHHLINTLSTQLGISCEHSFDCYGSKQLDLKASQLKSTMYDVLGIIDKAISEVGMDSLDANNFDDYFYFESLSLTDQIMTESYLNPTPEEQIRDAYTQLLEENGDMLLSVDVYTDPEICQHFQMITRPQDEFHLIPIQSKSLKNNHTNNKPSF
jgi:hypothetical protein